MPITAARRTYSAIAVRPIPTDREITRSLTPQAYFRRRTSRIFRIGNLSAGIGPPIASTAKGGTLPRSDCRQRPPSHPINRVAAFVRIGWPLSIGIGGRLPSESVAALPRNSAEGPTCRNAVGPCPGLHLSKSAPPFHVDRPLALQNIKAERKDCHSSSPPWHLRLSCRSQPLASQTRHEPRSKELRLVLNLEPQTAAKQTALNVLQ
ncbi:hypothetical protein ACVWZ6_006097 [Bradyrhizobium sp. GM6.1]